VSRAIAYPQLVRQRVRWARALKRARFFHGGDLLDYGINTAVEYGRWVDEYRKTPVAAALDQMAEQLMQMQAIQEVLEQRSDK
jgi:hypothetical protein